MRTRPPRCGRRWCRRTTRSSRLAWEKGFAELRDAARSLVGSSPTVRFVVAGPIEVEKADALGPDDIAELESLGFRFLGLRDDVEVVYAAADVNVLASHREGWPRSPMEAAAMGVPTVVTDIRGGRQVVDHRVTGLLVPVRDGAALGDGVRRLAFDPALRSAMGAAALAKARAEFDQQRVIDTTLAQKPSGGYALKRAIDAAALDGALITTTMALYVGNMVGRALCEREGIAPNAWSFFADVFLAAAPQLIADLNGRLDHWDFTGDQASVATSAHGTDLLHSHLVEAGLDSSLTGCIAGLARQAIARGHADDGFASLYDVIKGNSRFTLTPWVTTGAGRQAPARKAPASGTVRFRPGAAPGCR